MANLKKRIRIAAPSSAVHRALTDPDALRVWLAEHADVSLPDRYEFWGRFTPDGETPHQRLLHADDGSLRFEWVLDGVTTTVGIDLAGESEPGGDGESTVLTLTQNEVVGWPDLLADGGDRALMHTYWALALANLADYAEGRQPSALCDFTSPVLRAEILIDADRQAVYASLTEPEQFSRWTGARFEAEVRPGGRWAMGGFDANPHPAHVVDVQPGTSLTVDWGEMVGLVETWELADSDGRTRLTYVQSGFDEPGYDGWLGALSGFAELRRYHEIKNWRSRWVEVQLDGFPTAG